MKKTLLNGINRDVFATRALSAIERLGNTQNVYYVRAQAAIVEAPSSRNPEAFLAVKLVAILKALRADVVAGYLTSFKERITGEIFEDIMEMAQQLLHDGYKDAAATIAGGALEIHLRKLCMKHTIPVTLDAKPKKAERMNTDLAGAKVYTLLDQKSVTAWLDLRNKAAHGYYDQYTSDQVLFTIQALTNFIGRYPA